MALAKRQRELLTEQAASPTGSSKPFEARIVNFDGEGVISVAFAPFIKYVEGTKERIN